jgi:cellulose synthase/poly-beta-1,6-N-acetylglucosamine synthase-like glycosyltransferase
MERIQLVENLRDALLICAGWSSVNGLLLLSGNIMLLQKQAVIDCGGFLRDLVDEDGELILRMHRLLSIAGKPYRIAHSSNALGWTEVPRDRSKLRASRVRRYRGLCESVSLNQAMLWRGRPNVAGWIALPCLMLFECACPLVEVAGYVLLAALFVTGVLEWAAFLLLLAIALGLAILLPALSLLLEEACYRRTKDTRDTLALLADIVAGQFGDRQRKLLWSLEGMWKWVTGKRGGRRVTTRRTQP